MDQDLRQPVRRGAHAAPEAPADAPAFGAGTTVTPGAHVAASTAAVSATAATNTSTVTAALTRAERRSRLVRIPRVPRLRPQRFIVPCAIGVLVWLLVVQLVGWVQMGSVLSAANWGEVVGALAVTQAALLGQGIALWGGATSAVALGVLVRTAAAMAFAELIGGPVASAATAVALHRQRGLAPGAAYSSGLLSSVASVVVPLVLGIVFVPFALGDLHLAAAGPSGSDAALLQILLLVVAAIGLAGGVAFVVPRVRHALASRDRPQFASAWANVYEVTAHPGSVVRLLAGPALTQLVFAAGLGLCVHAVGASANVGALVLVCCVANVLGGITPVPGGMGVVEATYISGLTFAGVPQDLAAGATLLFRAASAYLPALWGWPALTRLRDDAAHQADAGGPAA